MKYLFIRNKININTNKNYVIIISKLHLCMEKPSIRTDALRKMNYLVFYEIMGTLTDKSLDGPTETLVQEHYF